MPDSNPPDLAKLVAPIAAELLPGWTLRCAWATQADMGRNLATVVPEPTRTLADVRVVWPWPSSESLASTLWHELTHAMLSPITHQLDDRPGSVMVEEQIVERLGNLLARVPAMARRAIVSAVQAFAPQHMRARLRGERGRAGGSMDPKLIRAALDALIEEGGGDGKCAGILKELIAQAAGSAGSDGDTAAPPPSDGDARPGAIDPPPGDDGNGADAGAPPQDGARMAARRGADVDDEIKRARKELADMRAEMSAMMTATRPAAKETLVVGLRARMGANLTPAAERLIMSAPTFPEAQKLAQFAEAMGGSGPQRARSGIDPASSPDTSGKAAPVTVAQLEKEGMPKALAEEIVELYPRDARMAEHNLKFARARLNPDANDWMPAKGSN